VYLINYLNTVQKFFNAKVGRESILKPTTGHESIHKICNNNGGRVVNLTTSKILIVRSTIFSTSLTFINLFLTYPDGLKIKMIIF
jgi:hypothetical protein